MFSKLVTAFALLGAAQAAVYTVTVGIDETNGHQGIGFDPSTIVPAVGDTITFTFQLPGYIKNPQTVQHSATQSTFDDPCTPKPSGFDTGVQSTGSENAGTGNSYSLLVNDTQPLWFFSSVGTDCKQGMVLAVNPPITGDETAAAFKTKAMASSGSSADTSPAPNSSTSSSQTILPSSDSNTSTSQATSTESAAASVTSPPPANNSNAAVSGNAKIDLGLAAMVAIVGVAFAT